MRKAEAESEAKRTGSDRKRPKGKVSGDDSWRAPPVPIPNTEVKPPNADGTELGTAWESRKLPGSKRSGRNESFSRSQNIRKNGAARRQSRQRSRGRSASEPEADRQAGGQANEPRHRPRMILSSSMAEHSAVNRRVVSSSLT